MQAQSNQAIINGATTAPAIFPGTGCPYNWTNSNPLIGLGASGSGDIPSFTAVNTGTMPITATITATPVSGGLAYTANEITDVVNVTDLATNSVLASIPVGSVPIYLAITPDDSKIYVSNYWDNTVSVISTATNTVIATISGVSNPYNIAVTPDGSLMYVANYRSNSIAVISTASNSVIATFPVEQWPSGMVVNSDGSKLYVASFLSNNVQVINTLTYGLVATIPVGTSPWAIALSPNGSKLYVANEIPGSVSVINTASNTVIATIPTGQYSQFLSVSPDGSKLYVGGSYNSNNVWVINTATNSVVSDINVVSPSLGIAVNPNGNLLYATDGYVISVINTVTDVITSSISVPIDCQAIVLDFAGVNSGTGCSSTPVTFAITVIPSPQITLAGAVTGNISACVDEASVAPDIGQFQVGGSYLAGDISVSAPAGFEVSLASGSGYSSSLTIAQAGGTVSNTVVYVRSAAMASPGAITGNIVLSSTGASNSQVAVTGTVNPEVIPTVNIAASSDEICAGAQVTFSVTGTNGGSSPSYQWLLNGNNTGTNSPNFTSANLVNGDVISCILASNASCALGTATSNSITMQVNAQPQPSVGIAASANPVCDGTPVTFTATPTNGGTTPTYQWLLDGNNTGSNSSTFIDSTLKNGNIIICRMTASTTCPDSVFSIPVTLVVYQLPTITFNPDTVLLTANGGIQLAPIVNGQIVQYQWTPAGGLNATNIATPIASPVTSIVYQLSVTDNNGCMATGKVVVIAALPLELPNAFTPNGDGHNDIFRIPSGVQFNLQELDIFDRLGIRVYTTRNIGEGWDGTYNGQPAPIGTYVYLVKGKTLAGEPVVLKGTLMLIR